MPVCIHRWIACISVFKQSTLNVSGLCCCSSVKCRINPPFWDHNNQTIKRRVYACEFRRANKPLDFLWFLGFMGFEVCNGFAVSRVSGFHVFMSFVVSWTHGLMVLRLSVISWNQGFHSFTGFVVSWVSLSISFEVSCVYWFQWFCELSVFLVSWVSR